jgi:DNA-binding NarL/FixJ family response regulator
VVGRQDQAIELFESACAFCRRAGYLPELAVGSLELAVQLAERGREGDQARSAALLEEARSLAHALGMRPLQDKVERRLRPRETPVPLNPYSLTPRQLEVLSLVARGFTNHEIGERLFISGETVAKHVHALLEKTGMANRAEVTAFAFRNGLVE